MRINVYAEEITAETALVIKTADTGTTFYGVRLFLESPEALHNRPDDDDRSAITLWVPWTRADGHDFTKVREVLRNLEFELRQAEVYEREHTISGLPGVDWDAGDPARG